MGSHTCYQLTRGGTCTVTQRFPLPPPFWCWCTLRRSFTFRMLACFKKWRNTIYYPCFLTLADFQLWFILFFFLVLRACHKGLIECTLRWLGIVRPTGWFPCYCRYSPRATKLKTPTAKSHSIIYKGSFSLTTRESQQKGTRWQVSPSPLCLQCSAE